MHNGATHNGAGSPLIGTTTNDNAIAGNIGEIIESTVAQGSAVALTTVQPANITSISLTAGDWDVWATFATAPASGTTTSLIRASINTTSATHATSPNGGAYTQMAMAFGADSFNTLPVGKKRLSLSATTTVYLVGTVSFAVSTMGGYGYLGAQRSR